MSRFFSLYYIFNTLGLCYYPLIRLKHDAPELTIPEEFSSFVFIDDREGQVIVVLAMILFMKFLRAPTMDSFFATMFLFCRVSFGLLLYLIDVWVMAWFIIIQISMWVLFTQPMYDGNHRFKPISNLETFEEAVIRSDKIWVVLFHSDLHQSCVHTYELWAKMSVKYTTAQMLFGLVNVDLNPDIAQKCVVSRDGTTRQLPSLIVYENEREVKRFPPIDKEGNIALVRQYKIDKIVSYLEIDKKYLATRGQADNNS